MKSRKRNRGIGCDVKIMRPHKFIPIPYSMYCRKCNYASDAFIHVETIKKYNKNYMKRKNKNLGCDVELGGIGDTMKYGTILLVGGGVAYMMWKFNLFGGLRWLKDAARDLYKAPETIAKWTDAEIEMAKYLYQFTEASKR